MIVEPDGAASPYERFTITLNPDGGRTLRAVARSPRGDLLRDVNMMVDAAWRPVEGMARLYLKGELAGTVLRRVEGGKLESYAWKPGAPIDHQTFEAPSNMTLGFHPLTGDAWKTNFLDLSHGNDQEIVVHTVSNTWNGRELGHGEQIRSVAAYLGSERLNTPAGPMDCEHFVWRPRAGKELHIWRTGEAHLLAKMLVLGGERPGTTYWLSQVEEELVSTEDFGRG